jgi:hypothetical protein
MLTRTAFCPAGVIKFPVGACGDYFLHYHERGWTAAGKPRNVFAETGALPLDGSVMHIGQFQADSGAGPQSTRFTLAGRFTPDGPETLFGPYTPRPDGYCDVRVDARELRVRIEETAASDWTIGRMWATGKARGQR